MPRKASNADRIARAAAEADAKAAEKAAKKAAAPPPRPRATPASRGKARLKVVWAVGKPGLEPVKTFAYPDRAEADAEAAKRGDDFRVAPLKIPME